MGYYDYLKALLEPLGVYDLRPESYSGAELYALGAAMDDFAAKAATGLREMLPVTAQDLGLDRYEAILPWRPAATTTEDRRAAILALLRMRGFSFAAICDAMRGCGVEATLVEGDTPGTVIVSFPGLWGEPEGYGQIQMILSEILPSHLLVIYALAWRTWQHLDELFSTWSPLAAMNWNEARSWQG